MVIGFNNIKLVMMDYHLLLNLIQILKLYLQVDKSLLHYLANKKD